MHPHMPSRGDTTGHPSPRRGTAKAVAVVVLSSLVLLMSVGRYVSFDVSSVDPHIGEGRSSVPHTLAPRSPLLIPPGSQSAAASGRGAASKCIKILLPWTAKYVERFAGNTDDVVLRRHGVVLSRRASPFDPPHDARCAVAPRRRGHTRSQVASADLVFLDSIGKMEEDAREIGVSPRTLESSDPAAPVGSLGLWNSENWRGRMREWSSKYRVRWLNRTADDSFWARLSVVVSFETTSDVPFFYADMFEQLDARLSDLRRNTPRRSTTSSPAAMFVASNCFNRYDDAATESLPSIVRTVVRAARVTSPAKTPRDREYFVKALQSAGLAVHSYGACLKNEDDLDSSCKAQYRTDAKLCTAARHLFYLSFENSLYPDYVTEKLYEPLAAGAIPVYLGAPNVAAFAPAAHSMVRVQDFDSVQALVHYLHCVARNVTVRSVYLSWRDRPRLPGFKSMIDRPTLVRLCDAVHMLHSNHCSDRRPRRPSSRVDPKIDALQLPVPCS